MFDTPDIGQVGERLLWLLGQILIVTYAIARPLVVMLIFPIFTRLNMTSLVRGSLALALALPMYPHLRLQLEYVEYLDPPRILAYTAKEGFIGLVIGFLIAVPFWGIAFAGDYIDQQREAVNTPLADPTTNARLTVTGSVFMLTASTVFLTIGGMALVADVLYASYSIWPLEVFFPPFNESAGYVFTWSFGYIFIIALTIGSPVIFTLIFSDFISLLGNKISPKLNVAALLPAIKNLIYTLSLFFYGGLFVTYGKEYFNLFSILEKNFRELLIDGRL